MGADKDVFNSDICTVNFIRSGTPGAEEARYKLIRSVLHRFIDRVRTVHDGIPQSAVTDQHTAVVSCDGDLGQVSCLRNPETIQKERDLKIVSWKHNPARTGTEQANDLGRHFPAMNRMEKSSTFTDSDEVSPTRRIVQELFRQAEDEHDLNLPHKKKETFMDALSRMPSKQRISATKSNIQTGYLKNGQIDAGSKMVPDILVMIEGTLGRPLETKELEFVKENFEELAKIMTEGQYP
jgi:hypothetical protein